MRPILLAMSGVLIFLLVLPVTRAGLGLEAGYVLYPLAKGLVACLLAAALTGGVLFRLGRLMYRHDR